MQAMAMPVLCCLAGLAAQSAEPARLLEIRGDHRVESDELWQDSHIRIYGSLVLAGGVLRIERCTVEIMCEYARHRSIRWEAGSLETLETTIGGTKTDGVTRPTTFELYEGSWTAVDTTVQYSTGVVFSYATPGRLMADRLMEGENPDSIIVCGMADVTLRDSAFNISLHLPAGSGSATTLDLPVARPLNRVVDRASVPGVNYRLELLNSQAPSAWFLFFVNVRDDAPPTRYLLGDCPNLVMGMTAINLKGPASLPCSWSGAGPPGVWAPMPKGSEIKVGSLTVATLTDRTRMAGWGVYLDGPETDVTITGSTAICELMVNEGRCRVAGAEGTHDVWVTCTTTDARKGASLVIENACLSYHEPSPHYKQILAQSGATVTLENVVFGDRLDLIPDGGVISIGDWQGNGAGVSVVGPPDGVIWRSTAP